MLRVDGIRWRRERGGLRASKGYPGDIYHFKHGVRGGTNVLHVCGVCSISALKTREKADRGMLLEGQSDHCILSTSMSHFQFPCLRFPHSWKSIVADCDVSNCTVYNGELGQNEKLKLGFSFPVFICFPSFQSFCSKSTDNPMNKKFRTSVAVKPPHRPCPPIGAWP